jgi:hypothetical protein
LRPALSFSVSRWADPEGLIFLLWAAEAALAFVSLGTITERSCLTRQSKAGLFMPDYQYRIGQKVFIRGAARLGAPRGAYQILERLPAQNDQARYLIRSLEQDNYKTIVDENALT